MKDLLSRVAKQHLFRYIEKKILFDKALKCHDRIKVGVGQKVVPFF